ncbi:hypothetical protein AAE369_004843 [Escherichia coli]
MTANDRFIPEDVYQSFSQLRDFVDGFSFLADMIPECESDKFDYQSLGYLLRMISSSLYGGLDVHWRAIVDAEFVKC